MSFMLMPRMGSLAYATPLSNRRHATVNRSVRTCVKSSGKVSIAHRSSRKHNRVETGVWNQQRDELAWLPFVVVLLHPPLYVLQNGQIPVHQSLMS